MQLKGEQLAAQLERELKPVYVVYGDEPLLVIEAADAIRAAARRNGFDERQVLTAIAGFNWLELHHAAGNMSLFGGRQLIDLRIPTGKPDAKAARPSSPIARTLRRTLCYWSRSPDSTGPRKKPSGLKHRPRPGWLSS